MPKNDVGTILRLCKDNLSILERLSTSPLQIPSRPFTDFMNRPSSTGPRARAREYELEGLACRFGVCPWLQRNGSLEVPASAKKTAIGADMACEEYNIPAPQISMLAWDDGRSLARMAVFFADESIRRSRRSNIELWGRGGACCVGAKSRWLFFFADTGLDILCFLFPGLTDS